MSLTAKEKKVEGEHRSQGYQTEYNPSDKIVSSLHLSHPFSFMDKWEGKE